MHIKGKSNFKCQIIYLVFYFIYFDFLPFKKFILIFHVFKLIQNDFSCHHGYFQR